MVEGDRVPAFGVCLGDLLHGHGLAHGCGGADDHELPRLELSDQAIHVRPVGFQHGILVGRQTLLPYLLRVQVAAQRIGSAIEVAVGIAPLHGPKQDLAHPVVQLAQIPVVRMARGRDLRPGSDQLPAPCIAPHDLGIVAGVDRRWRPYDQGGERRIAP